MSTLKAKVLEAEHIHLKINEKQLLTDVSIALHCGEVLGLIGANGAGKSTLLKVLARSLVANSGTLCLSEQAYPAYASQSFARKLAYLEQRPQVHWPLTAKQVIELGCLPWPGQEQQNAAAINEAIALTGCQSLLEQSFNTLSEGEKMLVNMARLLAQQTDIILADEPVAALDPFHQIKIMEMFNSLKHRAEKPLACMVVLHDLSLAARYCDSLILLDKGQVVATGNAEQVLTKSNLAKCYQVDGFYDTKLRQVLINGILMV